MLGVAVLEPVFGLAGLKLVGPPVGSDCAWAPAVLVLLGSELVCALAGKASIAAKRGTITKLRKCLGGASRYMSCPLVAQRPTPINIIMSPRFLSRRERPLRSPVNRPSAAAGKR